MNAEGSPGWPESEETGSGLTGAAFLHRLLANSGDCIKVLDRDGRLEFISAGGLRAMEIDDFGPFRGRAWLSFWSGAAAEAASTALAGAGAGQTGGFEGEAPTARGTRKVWDVVVTPIPGEGSALQNLLVISRDVTAQRRAEAALRESEARLETLVRQAAVGIAQTDPTGRFVLVNDCYAELLGRPREDVLGRTMQELTFPDDLPANQALFQRLLATGEPFAIEKRYLRPDGSTVWVSNHVSLTRDQQGEPQYAIAVSQDVTRRKRAEAEREALLEEVRHLALHDGLTGLPNRALFLDRLAQALAAARRRGDEAAAMLLDLDGFKDVNDTLGHAAGDRLLRQIGDRIAPVLRVGDTLARLGGDEFAIVQPGVRWPADAETLAAKVLAALEAPFDLDGQDVQVGASLGVALFPRDGEDAGALLHRADLALYRAKAEGRAGTRFFEPAMAAMARARRELAHELRRALAAGELVLHYQLQFDLKSGGFTAAEALVRWRHPERGLVPPGEFIPLAEATGLIRPLGEWILREACRQAAAWRSAGLPLTMTVNLSPAELRGQDAPPRIGQALRQAGLAPAGLELEITEGVLMETLGGGEASEFLRRLVARGVGLAIDDFGVGYSSLAYLRRLPVQKIKVDRSFVGAVGVDAAGEELLRSIVALGHSLGKRVVAEGVETEAQLAFLRAAGCDEAQGYYLARPMPAAELERWLLAAGATSAAPLAHAPDPEPWRHRLAELLPSLDEQRAKAAETRRRAAHWSQEARLAQQQAPATRAASRQLIRQVRDRDPTGQSDAEDGPVV